MSGRALIIIDMLSDFIDEKGKLYCGPTVKKIIPYIEERLGQARETDDLIIYLTDSHKSNDKEFKMFPSHCVKGTPGAEIIPELKPRRGEKVIRKTRYSGFYGTKLEDALKDNKIKQVAVVGVCTSICVMDTVGDLRNRDYEVIVYKKGVADFDQKSHRFALQRMEKTYGAKVI